MPYDSYASKGIFADLYKFMDSDAEMSRDKFMPNVLTALERNGKLYSIGAGFTVNIYGAKRSVVGDNTSLTIDEANGLAASLGDEATLLSGITTAGEFIESALSYSDFTDYENKTCNLDSPEFRSFLEASKQYPLEIDLQKMMRENLTSYMSMTSAVREGRALLQSVRISSFDDYNETKKIDFNDGLALVGFPVMEKKRGKRSAVIYVAVCGVREIGLSGGRVGVHKKRYRQRRKRTAH